MNVRELLAGYKGLLVGLLIAGVALVWLGSATQTPFWSSIGGALCGTSLGSLVGRLSYQTLEERVKDLVREGVKDSFVSDEEKIASSRIKWHLYHVTEMGGKVVWRHAILDFTKSSTPGRLTSSTCLLDSSGERQPYNVEAGRRDERFIVFLRSPTTQEPAATYVFPYMGSTYFDLHYGMSFLKTWDGTNAISPTILSPCVLHDYEAEGTLPVNIGQKLDLQWKRDINRLCHWLPDTSQSIASLG